MQELSDLGMLVLCLIYRAPAHRLFTRERLTSFVRDLNELNAVWGGMPILDNEVGMLLEEYERKKYIYTIQRKGTSGVLEPHFLLSPLFLNEFGAGIEKRIHALERNKEMACGYRHINEVFCLSQSRSRA